MGWTSGEWQTLEHFLKVIIRLDKWCRAVTTFCTATCWTNVHHCLDLMIMQIWSIFCNPVEYWTHYILITQNNKNSKNKNKSQFDAQQIHVPRWYVKDICRKLYIFWENVKIEAYILLKSFFSFCWKWKVSGNLLENYISYYPFYD